MSIASIDTYQKIFISSGLKVATYPMLHIRIKRKDIKPTTLSISTVPTFIYPMPNSSHHVTYLSILFVTPYEYENGLITSLKKYLKGNLEHFLICFRSLLLIYPEEDIPQFHLLLSLHRRTL